MTDDATKTAVKRGVDCIGVVAAFIVHDGHGRVLLQKRSAKCRDEQGMWDTGGGALEFGESFEECIQREVQEELCGNVKDIRFIGLLNVLREHDGAQTHWVSVGHAIRVDPESVSIGEPDKIDDIGWFDPNQLPEPPHTTLHRWIQKAREAGIF